MQYIDRFQVHQTSITLSPKSKALLKAALGTLEDKGLDWSESKLLHRLAMLYLQSWRGNKLKSATARRYNEPVTDGKYERVSWLMSKALYSVLWERAIHSGMSISRMLEFAVRYYLRRLLEQILRTPVEISEDKEGNLSITLGGDFRPRIDKAKILITYRCLTIRNSTERLKYWQKYEILPFDYLLEGKIPKRGTFFF